MENPAHVALEAPPATWLLDIPQSYFKGCDFAWVVWFIKGDVLPLRRTSQDTEGEKKQGNVTKIGCLVAQTLRQLTHMVLYFKHEENRLCLNSLVLLAGRLQESPSFLVNVLSETLDVFVDKETGVAVQGICQRQERSWDLPCALTAPGPPVRGHWKWGPFPNCYTKDTHLGYLSGGDTFPHL